MKTVILRAAALAVVSLLLLPAYGNAAQTPAPNHSKLRPVPMPLPSPRYPTRALHTEFKVEVNHMGQIVRVKSGKSCPDLTFNAQTYGNVLQMWIRHPDGSATVGMYRVTYDYDPKTKAVRRGVTLMTEGGDWGDEQGAANQMMDLDRKNRERHLALPGMNQLFKTNKPTPKPTH